MDSPTTEAEANAGTLRIDILTLFPEMFRGPFEHSMIARAQAAGLVDIRIHNIRDWATDKHRTTDDYAYGGGGGMVMKPEPIFRAVEAVLGIAELEASAQGDLVGAPDHVDLPSPLPCPIVLMTPQGRPFNHALAAELASADRVVIVAGHYEGYDERVRQHLATHEVSIGDFVVTGGELPAMLVADAVARLRPGVLGLDDATANDSFAAGRLEHPHYTRPLDFRGWRVPDVLVSGNHGEVDKWRRQASLRRTIERRPDLLHVTPPTEEEQKWLAAWSWPLSRD